MSDNSKYISGIFFNEKEGNYGTYFTVNISEEGLKNLNNLEKSDKGYRSFMVSRQRGDSTKFSVTRFTNNKPQATPVDNSTSELPF